MACQELLVLYSQGLLKTVIIPCAWLVAGNPDHPFMLEDVFMKITYAH